MADGRKLSWSPERRARQAEAIKRWRPWERSTGPRTAEGKAVSARNAFRGGLRAYMRQVREFLRECRKLGKGS